MSEPIFPAADPDLPATLDACRRCARWQHGGQPMAGSGPRRATIMLVGDQPGVREAAGGQPFSGTAGRLLDRALTEASLARSETYATYALKHHGGAASAMRGRDEPPAPHDVEACRYWLEREIRSVAPRVIVAFGVVALRAVLDDPHAMVRRVPLPHRLPGGERVVATLAPAEVLRTRGADSRERAWLQLVDALRAARRLAHAADEAAPGHDDPLARAAAARWLNPVGSTPSWPA